jgi:hypothetical protein
MRRPIVWLLGGALFLIPAAAQADAWDSRDVEAAERYRETERERAARYRESIASRSRPLARAPRDERPRPVASAPNRTGNAPFWWDGLVRAGVAEEDLRTLSGWIDGLGAWASFWQSEIQPRWQQWRDRPEPAPPRAVQRADHSDAAVQRADHSDAAAPPFLEALGAKLVQVVLAEVRHEAQRAQQD